MWQRIRQSWVILTTDAKIIPSALWFSAWLLSELGIRAWKQGKVNPAFPDALQRIQDDWNRLDQFLFDRLEQQAVHDTKIGSSIEHRAFLLTSMLAIKAGNIHNHMLTWTDTSDGDYTEILEAEAGSISMLRSKMQNPAYRVPIRPVTHLRIDDWDPRPNPPLATAARWAQMPFA